MRFLFLFFMFCYLSYGQTEQYLKIISSQQANRIPQEPGGGGDADTTSVRAFYTAYGGGATATGGRGGLLYIVNTLTFGASATYHAASGSDDAYYTGGYDQALEIDSVGYVVFNLSGNIDLGVGGNLWTSTSDKTVFGQSAPRGGITLTGGTNRFRNYTNATGNLIFRYMRSRPIKLSDGSTDATDDDAYTWAFLFLGGEDIILDHISGSFASDKIVGGYTREQHADFDGNYPDCPCWLRRFTVQHGLFGDGGTGMFTSVNPGRSGDPEELVDDISWLNNLSVANNRTPNMAFDNYGEVVNNVIYDTPTKNSKSYHLLKMNHVNNYYKRTNDSYNWIDTNSEGTKYPSIYANGNIYNGSVGGSSVNLTGDTGEDNSVLWVLADRVTSADSFYFTGTIHDLGLTYEWTPTTAQDAYDRLVTGGDVGAYKYLDDDGYVQIYRDSFDTEMLNVTANNIDYTPRQTSNWVLPSIPNNTRPSTYDTDNDGMADEWEIRTFGDLSQSYRGDFDGDGYENIEEYMNQVDL